MIYIYNIIDNIIYIYNYNIYIYTFFFVIDSPLRGGDNLIVATQSPAFSRHFLSCLMQRVTGYDPKSFQHPNADVTGSHRPRGYPLVI